ncbi:winged helix-turn-helix transcriptional regulator [Streptomyces sp. NPDC057555]|uniref:winged helix-turn-helix transcriptional regulator n=1 Tax=Streptomyces sp. NPDC057555 TaxID=3346166 RepID=UPI0036778522
MIRPRRATYELSPAGAQAVIGVHRHLAQWHHDHFPATGMAEAERIEETLRRLSPVGTSAVLGALAQYGQMGYSEIHRATGLNISSTHRRLQRLGQDGIVARTSGERGAHYTLTPAAHDLSVTYQALAIWAPPTPAPVPARPQQADTHRQRSTGATCAGVALGRSPAAVPSLFSDAPEPPTPVPAHVTAISRPARLR